MHPRLELDKVAPDALKAVLQVSAYVNNHSGLESTLLNLVYLRASQINGCASWRWTLSIENAGQTAAWRCTHNQWHKLETLLLPIRHQHDLTDQASASQQFVCVQASSQHLHCPGRQGQSLTL